MHLSLTCFNRFPEQLPVCEIQKMDRTEVKKVGRKITPGQFFSLIPKLLCLQSSVLTHLLTFKLSLIPNVKTHIRNTMWSFYKSLTNECQSNKPGKNSHERINKWYNQGVKKKLFLCHLSQPPD